MTCEVNGLELWLALRVAEIVTRSSCRGNWRKLPSRKTLPSWLRPVIFSATGYCFFKKSKLNENNSNRLQDLVLNLCPTYNRHGYMSDFRYIGHMGNHEEVHFMQKFDSAKVHTKGWDRQFVNPFIGPRSKYATIWGIRSRVTTVNSRTLLYSEQ